MNPFYPQHRFSDLGSAFLHPADIQQVRTLYGAGSGSVTPIDPIPEPATIMLVAVGLGLLARRRRSVAG